MERGAAAPGDFDMQVIGNFLSFASGGDRVGLNQMLRERASPDVHDYDQRTALHLAASEGHPPIFELLLQYKANVNIKDRWQRTPLIDARLYSNRDICRILDANGGRILFTVNLWLIAQCTNKDPSKRLTFTGVLVNLEEVTYSLGRTALCPVCQVHHYNVHRQ